MKLVIFQKHTTMLRMFPHSFVDFYRFYTTLKYFTLKKTQDMFKINPLSFSQYSIPSPLQKDIFIIEAVDLSVLLRVRVGHDGKGFGSGWFLDKIVVKESEDALKEYIFRCDRWVIDK